MLSKEKVMLMSKMAIYEKHEGEKDMRISGYYKKDYVGLHVITTVLWTLLGCLILAGLIGIACMDILLNHLTMTALVMLVGFGSAIFLALLIICCVAAKIRYGKRHAEARKRVKQYNMDLLNLMKLQKKEKM